MILLFVVFLNFFFSGNTSSFPSVHLMVILGRVTTEGLGFLVALRVSQDSLLPRFWGRECVGLGIVAFITLHAHSKILWFLFNILVC